MSNSLQPCGLQHTRLPCPSLSTRVCSNSYPLSQWCHPTISFSVGHPLLLQPSIFPSIRVFSNESVLFIRWPKYWSFSFNFSPFNEYSELISLQSKGLLRVFSNTAVQKHRFFGFSFFYGSTLTSIHGYWKTIALTRLMIKIMQKGKNW